MMIFKTDQFSFRNDGFSADASDLAIFEGAPLDIALRSPTGVTIRYKLFSTEKHDGDVKCWLYMPIPEDIAKHKNAARRSSVVIYND